MNGGRESEGAVALLTAEERVELVEPPPPERLGPGQARIMTRRVGFCGTDREMVHGGFAVAPDRSPFIVLGHELVGEVVELAPGAEGVSVGDIVVATIRRGCAQCAACKASRPDFCTTGRYLEHGIRRLHGFARPYAEIDVSALVAVPRELAGLAVFAEPLAVVEKAVEQVTHARSRIPGLADGERWRVLVAGTGSVGLMATALLAGRGHQVVTFDHHPSDHIAAAVAVAAGATYVKVDGPASEALVDHGRFDVVIEATGDPGVAFALPGLLDSNGVLVWIGMAIGTRPAQVDQAGFVLRAVEHQHVMVATINAASVHLRQAVQDLRLLARLSGLPAVMSESPVAGYREALYPGPATVKGTIAFNGDAGVLAPGANLARARR